MASAERPHEEGQEVPSAREVAPQADLLAFDGAEPPLGEYCENLTPTGFEPVLSEEESSKSQGLMASVHACMASSMYTDTKNDPELAEVINRWEAAPEAIKAGVLAMLRASTPNPSTGAPNPSISAPNPSTGAPDA